MRRWLALGAVLVVGAGGCAPVSHRSSPMSEGWEYEEARRNCRSCYGPHDARCQEPQLTLYVGRSIAQMCGGPSR
jgi:hypothetical protein